MKTSGDAKVFIVRGAIEAAITDMQIKLPQDTSIDWLFDGSDGIGYKQRQLIMNIVQGFVILLVKIALCRLYWLRSPAFFDSYHRPGHW